MPMNQFLLNILADPENTQPLLKEAEANMVNPLTGVRYPVIDNIPIFLKEEQILVQSIDTDTGCEVFDYRSHYENDAREFDYFDHQDSGYTHQERTRSRQSILNSVPADAITILDIGCGSAWVASKLLPKGKKVISMDISSSNPRKALKKFPHPNHAAIVADAFFLPFQNGSLDVVIASEVLEHVVDPERFISKVCEKIKPGGKFIMLTPYNEKLEYSLCIHCNKLTPKNAHLHSLNENNIRGFIKVKDISVKTKAFCNKYVLKLWLYNVLAFLPFSAWHFIDKLSNKIFRKPLLFQIEITKLK